MLAHNNIASKTERWLAVGKVAALSSLVCIAACADTGFFGGGPERTTGSVSRMQSDAENAVCQGNAMEAVNMLSAEPLATPADRFFLALSIEESGSAARARGLYAGLMQTGATDQVYVSCDGRVLANGTVSNESALRLADISRELAVLDVNLRPSPALHKGIPYSETPPPVVTTVSDNGYTGPALSVNRPASQTPLGQWFVHLVSYRSMENATENRVTIEKQFPAFAGILDQWEVDVEGLAIRLGVRVSDRGEADALCTAVKSNGAYCAVLNTRE